MRTPEAHYEAADAILAQLDGEDCSLPYARALITKASVHAQLAQLGCRTAFLYGDDFFDDEYDADAAAQCIKAQCDMHTIPASPQYL